jgi:alpha-mannosidase
MYYLLFLLLLLTPSVYTQAAPNLSRDKVLYVVGYAHLDTQWLWTYKTTIDEFIKRTVLDNFSLFERYPAYNFNFTGSIRYAMIKEYYPQHYARLKDYISQHRWYVSGSSVDEGDVNIPSPEAIFRQILLGNNFFRQEFDRESQDYMLPDCFGFPASLPSIWAHAGLKGFSTQKLTWGSAVGIPFNIGMWQGPDGKAIVAALNPGEYVGTVRRPLHTDPEWVERVLDNGTKYGVYTDYHYYGVGDQGGAPRVSDVKNVMASLGKDGPIKVQSAASDQLFKDLTEEQKAQLPRYSGDMLLTEHSAGSLTSQAYMKRWNRHNELLADSAERAGVMAQVLSAAVYPQEKLNRSWLRVLASQMHDILPGTSIPKAYEYSYNDEVIALNGFAAALTQGAGAVIADMDTAVPGIPLVVYNPLSFSRREVIEAKLAFAAETPENLEIIAADGQVLPAQILARDGNRVTFIFNPELAPVSYEVFTVVPASPAQEGDSSLLVSSGGIGNEFLRVAVNAAGDIASIQDQGQGKREILAAPSQLVFQYEQPAAFPSWNMDWKDRQLPPYAVVDGAAEVKVVEKGPVRVTIATRRQKLGSTFVQRISLSSGNPVLKVTNAIDWLSRNSSLKASFPLTVANPLATYNWGLGTIQRTNNNPQKYEVPSHEWFDLTAGDGSYGVSILEDSKFGSDKPSDNELRLTLLFTPNTERGGYHYEATQDWGHHDFSYGIYPHGGDWRNAGSPQHGERFNQPAKVFATEKHHGRLGRRLSFMSVSTPQVTVRALKKAENSSALIVRVQELWGQEAKSVRLSFAAPISKAWEVDGQERPIGEAQWSSKELSFDLGSYSPRTFALEFAAAETRRQNAIYLPLTLPLQADAVSSDGEKNGGAIGREGASYPGEQFPTDLLDNGIQYRLGDGLKNALFAEGQVIDLPQGNFNQIYILAAATVDSQGEFLVDGVSFVRDIPQWYGKIGDYDTRQWGPQNSVRSITPGFIKRVPLAWFASHRHLVNGENDAYTFSYLFALHLPLRGVARQLTLPRNSNIAIFAVTLAYDSAAGVIPAYPLYDDFSERKVVQP